MAGFHRLRVAFVAPPWYPVPPLGYGGIERVVYLLAQALARRGHDVTVFGRPGLADDVKVVPLAEPEWQTELGGYGERHRLATFLTRVHMQLRTRRFDVVHDHNQSTGLAMAIAAQLPCPVVTTIHGRLEEAEIDFFKETGTESELVAISRAQRSQAPDLPWSAVVHNTVPADELTASANKQDYLVQLARIAPDKGQHLSIQIAREVGLPLVLAGKIAEGEGSYFEGSPAPPRGAGYLASRGGRGGEGLAAGQGPGHALSDPVGGAVRDRGGRGHGQRYTRVGHGQGSHARDN